MVIKINGVVAGVDDISRLIIDTTKNTNIIKTISITTNN